MKSIESIADLFIINVNYIVQLIYFHGSQCCLKLFPIQKQNKKIQNGLWKNVLFWFRTISIMSYSFISVVVDSACVRKTSEMARGKGQGSRVSIVTCKTFEMEMSAKSYAVLSLSLCMMPILHLFPGPLLYQCLEKSSNFFSSVIFSILERLRNEN